MKVLWLTNTPVGASEYFGIQKTSGGWMSSLEKYIKEVEGIELAVGFFYHEPKQFKFKHKNVTYYPIKTKNTSLIGKIKAKLFNILDDNNTQDILTAIEDYKPDVIQLFGTESGLGRVLEYTDIPAIVHLQGLINPNLATWFPSGTTQFKLFLKSPFHKALLKKGVLGHYYLFKKRAKREESIIKNAKNFFGRTDWDRRVISVYNEKARYFHCDELLRKPFFNQVWVQQKSNTLHFTTTINPNIYKGLEIILQTAFLLKQKSKLDFNWSVVGIDNSDDLVNLMEKIHKLRFKENNVNFLGYKKVDELIQILMGSDVFIHPSHADNSPNSVCEAMLLGMPVIAGHVGGVPTLIENNVNGILFNSHDPFDLAGHIIEISKNKKKLSDLGRSARVKALKRHDAQTIIGTIRETYEKITAKIK